MLQICSLFIRLANARRRAPLPEALRATEGRSSCSVPEVSRFAAKSKCQSVDVKLGGTMPVSNKCELSPDFATNRTRFSIVQSYGTRAANLLLFLNSFKGTLIALLRDARE